MQKPTPPCKRDCDKRGTDVCHKDECPYGWKQYLEDVETFRNLVIGNKSVSASVMSYKRESKTKHYDFKRKRMK